jgi:anti-sigma B factor antagonist
MMRSGTPFEIRESQNDGSVLLALVGELDLDSTPVLEDRLTRLRAKKARVRLNLSELEFIDSTGLHLLIRSFSDARIDGWDFQIDPDIAPQVARLFALVHFDRFIVGNDSQEG